MKKHRTSGDLISPSTVANFDPSTFSLMRCEFCGAGFDTRAGLSSHARAHLRDFGITNWELTVSPIHVLARLLARSPGRPLPPFPPWHQDTDTDGKKPMCLFYAITDDITLHHHQPAIRPECVSWLYPFLLSNSLPLPTLALHFCLHLYAA